MAYKVPFVDFPAQYHRLEGEILAAVQKVFSGGDFILRGEVKRFEEDMASFLGVRYAVGLNSGTDALLLSLKAAGVGPGDEVITVAHTFVATIGAVVHSGATPVLVDIGDDFNMDVGVLEQAVTPRTRAVLPVHLNGRVCDMEKLMAVARRHNLIVIEDAAQALGAGFDGKKGGSFGLTGCFSLYPAKILGAAGDGGLVCTNDEGLAEKIRLLRDHGRPGSDKNAHLCYGFTSRLDNLQAAILNVKLKYVPDWIQRRRQIASLYEKGLSDIPGVKLPPSSTSDKRFFDVYQNYVLRVPERDRLSLYLKDKGIETLVSNPIPLHHQAALRLSHFQLPKTEQFAREVISIPLIPELSDEQVEHVVRSIRAFFGRPH